MEKHNENKMNKMFKIKKRKEIRRQYYGSTQSCWLAHDLQVEQGVKFCSG